LKDIPYLRCIDIHIDGILGGILGGFDGGILGGIVVGILGGYPYFRPVGASEGKSNMS